MTKVSGQSWWFLSTKSGKPVCVRISITATSFSSSSESMSASSYHYMTKVRAERRWHSRCRWGAKQWAGGKTDPHILNLFAFLRPLRPKEWTWVFIGLMNGWSWTGNVYCLNYMSQAIRVEQCWYCKLSKLRTLAWNEQRKMRIKGIKREWWNWWMTRANYCVQKRNNGEWVWKVVAKKSEGQVPLLKLD